MHGLAKVLAASTLLATLLAAASLTSPEIARGATGDDSQNDWQASDQPPGSVQWFPGPGRADLGTQAQIRVPDGFLFAGALDVRKVLEGLGDSATGTELGIVSPSDSAWFVVFGFDSVGYVSDDERESLDPAGILHAIQTSTWAANTERQNRGVPPIEVVGWEVKPQYDSATHNLEWAVRGRTNGHDVINYNVRILGREGVMKANLVIDADALPAALPKFRELLSGYEFKPGLRYADWGSGDRIAAYGLTTLIASGAAAAGKSSLFVKFSEVLVILIVIASLVGLVFNGLFRREDDKVPSDGPTTGVT